MERKILGLNLSDKISNIKRNDEDRRCSIIIHKLEIKMRESCDLSPDYLSGTHIYNGINA